MVVSSIALVFGILLSLSSAADDYTKTSDCQVGGLVLMILYVYGNCYVVAKPFFFSKHTLVYMNILQAPIYITREERKEPKYQQKSI